MFGSKLCLETYPLFQRRNVAYVGEPRIPGILLDFILVELVCEQAKTVTHDWLENSSCACVYQTSPSLIIF